MIDTAINYTSLNSLSVVGPSIYYGDITLVSSWNVIGNIIGSGTALAIKLEFNSKQIPDLTMYATNTNLI